MRLRVWSEFLTPDEVCAPEVLRLLRRFDVGLCLRTVDFERLALVLERYQEAGLEVTAWLLLPKRQGYWPGEGNAVTFGARARDLLAWAAREHLRVPWLAVDLEPPIQQAELLAKAGPWARLRLAAGNLNRRRFARASGVYKRLAWDAQRAGTRLLCAAHDYVRDDLLAGSRLLQDLHEAPVLAAPWDVISAMLYTSLDGSAPADAHRWLYEVARDLRLELGPRAGASIGLTATGVLGNEPFYGRPEQLAPDVAALKAAGVEDVAIYSLEGILRSSSPEAWLEMATVTRPATPPETPESRRRALRHRLLRLLLRAVR